ncbi:MAG: hypothetical protein PGN08_13960 [Sphingomonas taxi]
MQEAMLADPAFFLDEDAVHDRDLPCGSPERQHRDAEPDPEGLAQRDRRGPRRRRDGDGGGGHAGTRAREGWCDDQLWRSAVASRAQRYSAS